MFCPVSYRVPGLEINRNGPFPLATGIGLPDLPHMTTPYTREQEAELRSAVRVGDDPLCPTCRLRMEVQNIEARSDVAYVRSRRWLRCGSCRRSLVVDLPRGTAK